MTNSPTGSGEPFATARRLKATIDRIIQFDDYALPSNQLAAKRADQLRPLLLTFSRLDFTGCEDLRSAVVDVCDTPEGNLMDVAQASSRDEFIAFLLSESEPDNEIVRRLFSPHGDEGTSMRARLERLATLLSESEVDASTISRKASKSIDAESNTRDENAFIREGSHWRVRFDGSEAFPPHRVGFVCIARLLSAPDEDVTVSELTGKGLWEMPLEIADMEVLEKLKQKIEEVTGQLEEAEQMGSLSRASLAEKKAALEADLLERMGGNGGRKVRPSADKQRKTVSKAIKDSINSLKGTHPPLYLHLRNSIKTGFKCRYAPTEAVRWRL